MAVTDLTFLNAFSNGNGALKKQFIQMFISSAPNSILEMKQAAAENRLHDLGRGAHSIKPQFSYMGIDSCTEQILKLEKCDEQKLNENEIQELINAVSQICSEAVIELQEVVNEL